jgi:hypothetical protein
MLLLFKKLFYLLVFLALIVTLGSMVSSNEINHSFSYKYDSSFTEIDKQVISVGVFLKINQAANFNHLNQMTSAYILVTLLVLFLVCAVNYLWYTPTIPPPPWYLVLRHCSRINLSGWKVSNLHYKAQLTYQK